eukprot:scaffold71515_cov32-Tisochrysis_lutea.AAC.1
MHGGRVTRFAGSTTRATTEECHPALKVARLHTGLHCMQHLCKDALHHHDGKPYASHILRLGGSRQLQPADSGQAGAKKHSPQGVTLGSAYC